MTYNITEKRGNIFSTECEVITLTVNCEGVMGAGIALEGKFRWPLMYEEYEKKCSEGLKTGELFWWGPDEFGKRILCFPTKYSWKQKSLLQYVEKGLDTLLEQYVNKNVKSIALPHLGCSHGGLEWADVKPIIYRKLSDRDDLEVELWEFDPLAEDEDFNDLVDLVRNQTPSVVQSRMGLSEKQENELRSALTYRGVKSFSSLQKTRGIGEKTLKRIYHYLFYEKKRMDFNYIEPTLPLGE
tara:strand:+ start:85 stop:807 length:723 start_codon:yes stop_codon:yes gene_type:complete